MPTTESTPTRAPGLALVLGLWSSLVVGACFNPPSDAVTTGPNLGCTQGALGCPCTDAGTCDAGLQCESSECVEGGTPTGTDDATTGTSATPATTLADSGPGDTTLALDGTSSGGMSTSDGTTSEGTTAVGSTGAGSTGTPVEPAMETVNFPIAADPRVITAGTLPWNVGDYFEGMRNTMVPSVTQLDVHVVIVQNGLTACGFQEAQVLLNGVSLGSFVVAQGTAVIDQSFAAPMVAGPAYTIRYQTVATVASGCGAAGYDEVSSTVTLWE